MSHVLYPATNFKAEEQLQIVRGEGVYVYDDNGKEYIEGLAGLWCTGLGHGNQELIDTCAEAMKNISYAHNFGGMYSRSAHELGEKLSSMLPVDNASVFFGVSGSDANDTHLKFLRYYFDAIGKPEKRKVIARERAYHGVTMAAACLTGLPVNQQHFDLPVDAIGVLRTHAAHYYRGQQGNESETEYTNRILGDLEKMILAEGPETIAAFIAEPITGAGGVMVPPDEYFPKLTRLLRKYDIFLIADEVITGFGRSGEVFAAPGLGAPNPDMMTMAKQVTSAYYPLSVAAVRGDMHQAVIEQSNEAGVFGHGYTYSGHSTGCSVALKALEIYERDGIYDNAAAVGAYMQEKLGAFASHPLVGEVRGKGLIAGIELVANKETREEFDGGIAGTSCLMYARDNGLIVRAIVGNTIAVCPPMIIDREQIDLLVDRLGDALDKSYAVLKAQGRIAA